MIFKLLASAPVRKFIWSLVLYYVSYKLKQMEKKN
jgi:hypothetical protein